MSARARTLDDRVAVDLETLPIALVLVHGAVLLAWPSIPLIGITFWWNANTISHNFIHRPLFRTRTANAIFSAYLTLLLGVPQSLWRKRHLAHHRSRGPLGSTKLAPFDLLTVTALWVGMLYLNPHFLFGIYLPGFLVGVSLCYLQGHYEHSRVTTSHYGRVYNLLFLNDGYHVEHHTRPGAHWRDLPKLREASAPHSAWPPVLRWLDSINLCALERAVLRFRLLQGFVLRRHESAFRRVLHRIHQVKSVGIVGGGLFPRTAIVLERLLPAATLVLVDQSADNLAIARRVLGHDIESLNQRFDALTPCDFDLIIIPLAFAGDRNAIYRHPPAPITVVHDWIWRRRGEGAVVSWMLLKRLNVVGRHDV
jgi:hypothetical protein